MRSHVDREKTFVGNKVLTIDWSVKMPCYRLCIGTKLNAPSDRLLPCACDNLVKTPSARIAGLLFEKLNKLQIVKEDPARLSVGIVRDLISQITSKLKR